MSNNGVIVPLISPSDQLWIATVDSSGLPQEFIASFLIESKRVGDIFTYELTKSLSIFMKHIPQVSNFFSELEPILEASNKNYIPYVSPVNWKTCSDLLQDYDYASYCMFMRNEPCPESESGNRSIPQLTDDDIPHFLITMELIINSTNIEAYLRESIIRCRPEYRRAFIDEQITLAANEKLYACSHALKVIKADHRSNQELSQRLRQIDARVEPIQALITGLGNTESKPILISLVKALKALRQQIDFQINLINLGGLANGDSQTWSSTIDFLSLPRH